MRSSGIILIVLIAALSGYAQNFRDEGYLDYIVPPEMPEVVDVEFRWRGGEAEPWRPAAVTPLLSETAQALVAPGQWEQWRSSGRIRERHAAGQSRQVRFHFYPDYMREGLEGELEVAFKDVAGKTLLTYPTLMYGELGTMVKATYIERWDEVLTRGEVLPESEAAAGKWQWQMNETEATFGNALYGKSTDNIPLRPLAYPLDLKGPHAIYVCTKPGYSVRIRLSSDERSDDIGSRLQGEEVLWKVANMDHQHLVIQQPHKHTGYAEAQVDYVKLLPLSEDEYAERQAQFGHPRDRFVAAYFEPYSWAFFEDVTSTLQHRQPLIPYAETGMSLVDIQIGRFGMKSVFETRLTDQLLYSTIGDPIGDEVQPTTDNVGRMQQYTNTLNAELRYCRELGLKAHANFGASNCYVGTPLQGDFSKQHPEWVRGSALRLEVPEARAYAMGLYRESLELGAPGISIDFCRYPESIDSADAATQVLREMRALADEFTQARTDAVTVLVRFPGAGVRMAEHFDYATWARDGLVDYLCPSNIQGRHMHIDMAPYLAAVQGTKVTLLPAVDGLYWGLMWPGQLLWRVKQLYDQGAPGVYVYQADARLLGRPQDRRTMALLNSKASVDAWWQREEDARPMRTKGIYISPASELGVYHHWERIRVWLEGIEPGPMVALIDGQEVSRCEGPPYMVGTEDYASDKVIPPGDHQLTIRAKDGDGWLEEVFLIKGE